MAGGRLATALQSKNGRLSFDRPRSQATITCTLSSRRPIVLAGPPRTPPPKVPAAKGFPSNDSNSNSSSWTDGLPSRYWTLKCFGAVGLVTAGVSIAQVMDLQHQWINKFRAQATHCAGPTEGTEWQPRSKAAAALANASAATVAKAQEAAAKAADRMATVAAKAAAGVAKVPGAHHHHASVTATPNTPSSCSSAAATPMVAQDAEAASGEEPKRPTLLLFLGDSLVSGVGAQLEGSDPQAAALPRNVAAKLSHCVDGQVCWASVGITGADVEQLREEGLPRLKEKVEAYKAQAGTVVVVLVVGVNDLRKVQLSTYRSKLRHLVSDLRYIMCNEKAVDAVVLPALRIGDAPLLQRFPLNCFAAPLCSLWEREKSKAIRWLSDSHVLPFPHPPQGDEEKTRALFCPDGMHPSSHGYEWWADSLAQQIHHLLSEREARRLAAVEEVVDVSLGMMPL